MATRARSPKVAKNQNASPGTAPVAAIVSPKGPPFASPGADDCKPLQVGQPALPAGVDALDDRLRGRPVERRVQPIEPLALLAPALHDAVRQPELPEVTPRHRLAPTPFPALNQKLAGRAKVSGWPS